MTTPTQPWREMLARLRSDAALALLALLFFVLPLYRTSALEDSFITPKVALAAIFGAGVLLVLFARGAKGRVSKTPNWLPVGGLLLGFLALNALTLLYCRSTALAVHALAYFVTFFVLYFACLFSVADRQAVKVLFYSGIAAGFVTAVWSLLEDWFGPAGFGGIIARLPDWRGYLAAGLGNSGHIAGLIGLFLPAAIILFLKAPRFRPGLFFVIFVMFAALVITWSVGSTGSTLLSLGIWCAITLKLGLGRQLHWRRVGALLAAGILVTAFYFLPHPLNPHSPSLLSEAFGSHRWAEGGPTRVAIWKTTWQLIEKHPLLGVGVGNFTLEYVRQVVPSIVSDPALRNYAGSFTNEAHNEYLQIWSESGITALVVYLALLVVYFARVGSMLRQNRDENVKLLTIAAAAGVSVFALDSLMTFPLRLPAHIASLMLLLAIPEALRQSQSESSSSAGSGKLSAWSGAPESPAASAPNVKRLVLVAVLLVLALGAGWVHARRVAAEFFMKQARTVAESEVALIAGKQMSAWGAADHMFTMGGQLLAAGKTKEASEAFEMARNLTANSSTMRNAEQLFERSLAWDPYYSNALSRYGALLLMQGKNREAVQMLTRALHELEAPEIHERLGFAYYFLGEKAQAAREWKLLVERRPQFRDYFEALVKQAGS